MRPAIPAIILLSLALLSGCGAAGKIMGKGWGDDKGTGKTHEDWPSRPTRPGVPRSAADSTLSS